jgi:hypothetical protein
MSSSSSEHGEGALEHRPGRLVLHEIAPHPDRLRSLAGEEGCDHGPTASRSGRRLVPAQDAGGPGEPGPEGDEQEVVAVLHPAAVEGLAEGQPIEAVEVFAVALDVRHDPLGLEARRSRAPR